VLMTVKKRSIVNLGHTKRRVERHRLSFREQNGIVICLPLVVELETKSQFFSRCEVNLKTGTDKGLSMIDGAVINIESIDHGQGFEYLEDILNAETDMLNGFDGRNRYFYYGGFHLRNCWLPD